MADTNTKKQRGNTRTTAFTEDRCENIIRELKRIRTTQGREGIARWAEPFLDAWRDALDAETPGTDGDALGTLAVAMGEVLVVRDAVIMATLSNTSREECLGYIGRIRDGAAEQSMRSRLSAAYDHAEGIDGKRVRTAAPMLETMRKLMPGTRKAQPAATEACLLWMDGDRRAFDIALAALDSDETCNLALIVISAITRNLYPGRLH